MINYAEDIDSLLSAAVDLYGYDFSGYSRRYMLERICASYRRSGYEHFDEFRRAALADHNQFDRLCGELMTIYSEMFRDPPFFLDIRTKLVPYLRSFPSIRIWCAGCGRGEEAYSLAILLEEEGIYDRCTLFATDLLASSLEKAQAGWYHSSHFDDYEANYRAAGGKRTFSEYVMVEKDGFVVDAVLRRNIHFFTHNLLVDQVFAQMNLIFCRNVCIYLNEQNRQKVLKLLGASLVPLGFLGMGSSEFLDKGDVVESYRTFAGTKNIFQKWDHPLAETRCELGEIL